MQKLFEGTELMLVALMLFRIQREAGGHASLEQPRQSQAAWLPEFQETMRADGVQELATDY